MQSQTEEPPPRRKKSFYCGARRFGELQDIAEAVHKEFSVSGFTAERRRDVFSEMPIERHDSHSFADWHPSFLR
jgi:hypothetical protein